MARVLVIDDEPDVRWLIRMSLERAGHEVLDAEDGLARDRPGDEAAPGDHRAWT